MRALALLLPAAAVLWSGAAHPPATLALAVASALLLLGGRELRLTPLALIPLALALLCLLQLAFGLSLDPPATLDELPKLLGAACLAIALQPAGTDDRDMLRASLALAGAALVGPALLDALGVPLGRVLLPIEKVRAPLRFPLGDSNHAASLLLLLLPLIVHQVWKQRGQAQLIAGACWMLGNLVLVATASRAGVALGLLAQAAAGGWLARRHGLGPRWWVALVAVPALALMLAGGTLAARLANPNAASQNLRLDRLELWRDALVLARDHVWTGVGRGAFEPAFTLYDRQAGSLRHGFVENQYLQVLADGGLLGVLLTAIAGALAVQWLRRPKDESDGEGSDERISDTGAMALVSLTALALHNGVEFSIEAGGVAASACAVGALALPGRGPPLRSALARPLALLTLAAVLAAAVHAKGARADADLEALISAPVDRVEALAEAALARHPADGHLAAVAAMRLQPSPVSALWLERALQRAPHDLLAHRTAVRVLLAARETRQAAGEMRQLIDLSPPVDVDNLLDEAVLHFGDLVASAVPERLWVRLLDRLLPSRRWPQIEAVGAATVAAGADNPDLLRRLLQGALLAGQPTAVQWAERLGRLSHAPHDGLLIANALLAAERTDDAERVLREALARAVETADKVDLHRALAAVAVRQGNTNQAALENKRAADLTRH